MGHVLAIVAPGQGAQTPGFLSAWLEVPTFATRLAWLSAVTGLDLAHYGTEADAEAIREGADDPRALSDLGLLGYRRGQRAPNNTMIRPNRNPRTTHRQTPAPGFRAFLHAC